MYLSRINVFFSITFLQLINDPRRPKGGSTRNNHEYFSSSLKPRFFALVVCTTHIERFYRVVQVDGATPMRDGL